jgi:hypothetical protein
MKALRILPVVLLACAASLQAQTPHARAEMLAGEFTKFKHAKKEKHGVSHEKYKDVVSEPWVAKTASEYAGSYLSDDVMRLEISIDNAGNVTGSGRDTQSFVLRGLEITGALITGSKVYASGRTEPFEAALLKRSDRDRPDARYTVLYGIGTLVDGTDTGFGSTARVFARRQ